MENYVANFKYAVISVMLILADRNTIEKKGGMNSLQICRYQGVKNFGLANRSRELLVAGILLAATKVESDEEVTDLAWEAAYVGCPWWQRFWLRVRNLLELPDNHQLAYDW